VRAGGYAERMPQPPGGPDPVARACRLIDEARFDAAAALLRRHAQKHPGDHAAIGALCHALNNLGLPEQSVHYARGLQAASPGLPGAWMTLGEALEKARRHEEAEGILREGLRKFPRDAGMAFVLAESLRARGRLAEAVEVCDRAIAEGWATDAIRSVRATTMHKMGRLDEAMKFVRESQWLAPGQIVPAEIACATANYDPGVTPEQAFALHRRYANTLNDHFGTGLFRHPDADDPDRPLRVGVLSPDLRRHSVGFFALPLLRALRGAFQVVAFNSGPEAHATSQRFRALCHEWHTVAGMSMLAVARFIHAARIDVLFELSGLTTGQAMPVMQARPAPVQVTYIGYPASTGLWAIDYRIVDSLTDPPGAERLAAERLVRLDPCFLCFEPWEPPPPVAAPPSSRGEPFTFGSFNSSMKINDRTLALWGRVLAAVPGSRLMVKMLETDSEPTRRLMLDRFASRGLPPDRVLWRTWEKELSDHLGSYSQVDVGLDPFPYCGTTTTCEAMLMGVPVISLVGDRHAARVGLSLLSAVGIPEFAVPDEASYISLAVRLAGDPERLAGVRAGLRERMLGSALCRKEPYEARMARAVLGMWAARCAGTPRA
jgi:protein O-GlcNAc transferase